jgi:hypothetical protein
MQRLFISVLASCCAFSAPASDRIEGTIALSSPQCPFFVVLTSHGFSLLHEDAYYGVFEGDHVQGSLCNRGSTEVKIVGEITLQVTVEDWGLGLKDAHRLFYGLCRVP